MSDLEDVDTATLQRRQIMLRPWMVGGMVGIFAAYVLPGLLSLLAFVVSVAAILVPYVTSMAITNEIAVREMRAAEDAFRLMELQRERDLDAQMDDEDDDA